uniref:Zgc:163057 n=1 Tax=Cyprinus carpio TaxID=7962 RepID=A0A8C1ZIM9_CYPCA
MTQRTLNIARLQMSRDQGTSRWPDVHNVPQNKDTLLARNISTLTTTLASLRSLHAYQLRIHPTNFKLFNHCILNGCHMGENFNPVAHAAIDNFLSAFSAVLAEKFR